MADQPKPNKPTERPPTTHRTVKFLTAATLGATLLVLSGLTLTSTVISLVVATPLLVIFSPVLVPAAIVTLLVAAGFISSGWFGVPALAVLSWIYSYVRGKHPPGSEHLDHAKRMLASKAKDMREKASKYGYQVQNMAPEAIQGS